MKTKKLVKKLSLSKETVANVAEEKMNEVRGGALTHIGYICDTLDCTLLKVNCNSFYCQPSVPPLC